MNRTLRELALFLVLFITSCSTAPPKQDVRAELEAMLEPDQRYRNQVQELRIKMGPNFPGERELMKKQAAIDRANLKRLDEIVAAGGWPARSTVGEKAAFCAFLVVQHSDFVSQVRYLPLLKAAVSSGEARPQDLALLEDRVLTGVGLKQRYGSQVRPNGKGGLEFYPIEDEEHVDERRKAVGLEPMAEYAPTVGLEYKAK